MQQNKSGMKSNTSSATTTSSAKQSSEGTGRDLSSMATSENLLPTPTEGDSKGRTYQYDSWDKNKPRLCLLGMINLLPTPDANQRGERSLKGMSERQVNLQDAIRWSTFSQEGSHASRSLMLAKGGEKAITAICGQRCLRSFNSPNLPGSSLKTFTESLVLSKAWSSNRSALTWKKKATKFGRSLFQLVPSMPPTEGTGSGLLGTPNTMDHMNPKSEKSLWKEATQDRRNRSKPGNLRDQLSNQELWDSFPKRDYDQMLPTPDASDRRSMNSKQQGLSNQIQMLPSPQARDWKGKSIKRDRVPDSIENHGNSTGNKLRLQPAFVEWMMGYPKGWTKFRKQSTEQKD